MGARVRTVRRLGCAFGSALPCLAVLAHAAGAEVSEVTLEAHREARQFFPEAHGFPGS